MKTSTQTEKHTPGPWEVHYSEGNKCLSSVKTRNREPIAPCVGQQAEANARLIAAAPELLEALQEMLAPMDGMEADEFIPETAARINAARAAINKAINA